MLSALSAFGADPAEVTASAAGLRRFLRGLPGVDQAGLEARAAKLGTRSVRSTSKAFAIDLAISMIDLTTLEGADTHGRVRALCAKARHRDPAPDPAVSSGAPGSPAAPAPRPAAVCVYGDLVPVARTALAGSDIKVAAVATAFPAGRATLDVKLADVTAAVAAGADEIDMVIDRGAFLAGRHQEVFDEIVAVRAACGQARLKVILETGELATYDNVRRAAWLAMLAGADFVKTSTGKVAVNATVPVTLLLLESVRDFRTATGRQVGVKAAGGIRTTKDAVKYLVTVDEIAGADWMSPEWFRLGASGLLNDLLMQRQKLVSGHYAGSHDVSAD